MCCEDHKIARESGFRESNVTVDTSEGAVLSRSPNRIAIIFLQTTGNRVHLTTQDAALSGRGVTVTHDGIPVEVCDAVYGSAVQAAWRGIADTGATVLSVIEVFDNTCQG